MNMRMIIIICFLLSGCLSLPEQARIETPSESAAMPLLPDANSDDWMAVQGLPLRMKWLKEGESEYQHGKMFILPYVLTTLPYNNVEENQEWVDQINRKYQPATPWVVNLHPRMGHYKCMSLSIATVINWHMLNVGQPLPEYRSWLNGLMESGIDHRVIDAAYYHLAKQEGSNSIFPLLKIELDPVEQTPISYSMPGFVDIVTKWPGAENNMLVVADQSLPGVEHHLNISTFPKLEPHQLFGYSNSYSARQNDHEHAAILKEALRRDGPVYAGIRVRFASSGGVVTDNGLGRLSIPDMSGHGVVIVGYVEQRGQTFFVYRETFGKFDSTSSDGGPAYRAYPAYAFNEAYSFGTVRR